MLKEGNKYWFTIQRLIEMPPDGEPYFVLEGEEGVKFLMPEKFYSHYGLLGGQSIVCKVDKINCSGKIFLEPEHPWCKQGDMVVFKPSATIELKNSFGEEERMLVLKDPWGQMTWLNITGYPGLSAAAELVCRVERIKKGVLLVSHPDIQYFPMESSPDEMRPFEITGIRTLAENLEYYLLRQGDALHYLRTKYYTQYGFDKGTGMTCRLLGKPALFEHYLEPLHPYYQVSGEYWFDYLRTEQQGEITGKPQHRLVVRDLLGHEYPLNYEGREPVWVKKIKARVLDIRMSKCTLEITELE